MNDAVQRYEQREQFIRALAARMVKDHRMHMMRLYDKPLSYALEGFIDGVQFDIRVHHTVERRMVVTVNGEELIGMATTRELAHMLDRVAVDFNKREAS